MKLMIVDDSNIIRSKIERIYQHDENVAIVCTANTGRDAVEKAKILKPTLVTMDLTMPRMDGLECIKRLISIDPDIKILVVSALSDIATGLEAIESGARGFLCKPFTDQQLTSALAEIIHTN